MYSTAWTVITSLQGLVQAPLEATTDTGIAIQSYKVLCCTQSRL
jgi:hypothetical protein